MLHIVLHEPEMPQTLKYRKNLRGMRCCSASDRTTRFRLNEKMIKRAGSIIGTN